MQAAHVELLEFEDEGVTDGLQLGGDDGQDRHVDTVELVKAPPGPALTDSRQNLSHGLHNNAWMDAWMDGWMDG